MVDSRGYIYVGSQDDKIYCLTSSGKVRFSVSLGRDVDSSPALGPGGRLYVGCDTDHLVAIR